MNEFNNYYCQHSIPAISCSVCNAVQPKQYNQFETQIKQYKEQLTAYKELVEVQKQKINELYSDLAYANQTIENLTDEEPMKEEEEEPQYLYVYNHTYEAKTRMSPTFIHETYGMWIYMGKVKVEK
jgi:septal ring factor EnvC (AmiA/AmiB activator)